MILSRSPVRLSLGGGGTDLASYYEKYGGFLMAATINKYVYLMINKRFQDDIRLSYSKTEIVDNTDSIEHNIFRETLKYLSIKKHIELVSMADIPSQCGLGTSSSFTVALLNGLYTYKKEYKNIEELAETACHIEINILKEPIGKQDQYASAFGGFNCYWFNKDGSVQIEPVSIEEERLFQLQNNILLFYMGKERKASSILEMQNKKSKENDSKTIDRLHKIKELGFLTKKVFETGEIDKFGEILHEHWITKKGLSDKITDPFIDEAYDMAIRNGAIGGKIVGAGGGGFLLLYCPIQKTKLVRAMEKINLYPMWFRFEPEGVKTIFHN